MPLAGAAFASGVAVDILQKLTCLLATVSQYQMHQSVLSTAASAGNLGAKGISHVQHQVGEQERTPTPICSFGMAQPVAPRQPRRLREYLQEQQLTVNEAAVRSSLSFAQQNQPAVAALSHADGAADHLHALPPTDCNQPRANLAQRQVPVSPFGFVKSGLPGSQVSTPCFQSRRASTLVPSHIVVGDACAHHSSTNRASTTGDTLRKSDEALRAMTHIRARRHTEDLSDLSGFQLQAVRRLSGSKPPLCTGRSRSTTERRRSRLGMPPTGLLCGPDDAAAETTCPVSKLTSSFMLSSHARASGSVSVTASGSTDVSAEPASRQELVHLLGGLPIDGTGAADLASASSGELRDPKAFLAKRPRQLWHTFLQ